MFSPLSRNCTRRNRRVREGRERKRKDKKKEEKEVGFLLYIGIIKSRKFVVILLIYIYSLLLFTSLMMVKKKIEYN